MRRSLSPRLAAQQDRSDYSYDSTSPEQSALTTDSQLKSPIGVRIAAVAGIAQLIGFGIALSAAWGGWWPEDVPYLVAGQRVPREIWLKVAAPVLAAASGWLLAFTVGTVLRRAWSRYCVIGLFVTVIGFSIVDWSRDWIDSALAVRALAQAIALGLVAYWYFFRKRNVAAYYQSLGDPR